MKIILAAFLVIILLIPASGLALAPEFPSTASFLADLDAEELVYTFEGKDSDGDEKVTVILNSEVYDEQEYTFFFVDEENEISLRLWDIIHFDAADRLTVLGIVNVFNTQWKYCSFYVDENDNTVNAKWDAFLPKEDAGPLVTQMLISAHWVLEEAYPTLRLYSK